MYVIIFALYGLYVVRWAVVRQPIHMCKRSIEKTIYIYDINWLSSSNKNDEIVIFGGCGARNESLPLTRIEMLTRCNANNDYLEHLLEMHISPPDFTSTKTTSVGQYMATHAGCPHFHLNSNYFIYIYLFINFNLMYNTKCQTIFSAISKCIYFHMCL